MRFIWDFDELFDFGDRISDFKNFDEVCTELTRAISKVYLNMVQTNTPVKTGKLRIRWVMGDNVAYRVTKVDDGYMVEFSNDVEYAHWVNYGHRVRNGRGGDFGSYYKVKRRTVPYYDGNSSDYFVYGHFFIEKSIEQLTNGNHVLEHVCYRELEKWFRWCVSGK